jgi:hypothetical protein
LRVEPEEQPVLLEELGPEPVLVLVAKRVALPELCDRASSQGPAHWVTEVSVLFAENRLTALRQSALACAA